MGVFFIQFGRKRVYVLPTKLVSKQYQVLGGVLVGQGDVTRCVIHTNATVVHIVIAITQSQRMLLIDLPLQTCFWTQLADVLTVGRRLAIGYGV